MYCFMKSVPKKIKKWFASTSKPCFTTLIPRKKMLESHGHPDTPMNPLESRMTRFRASKNERMKLIQKKSTPEAAHLRQHDSSPRRLHYLQFRWIIMASSVTDLAPHSKLPDRIWQRMTCSDIPLIDRRFRNWLIDGLMNWGLVRLSVWWGRCVVAWAPTTWKIMCSRTSVIAPAVFVAACAGFSTRLVSSMLLSSLSVEGLCCFFSVEAPTFATYVCLLWLEVSKFWNILIGKVQEDFSASKNVWFG